MVTERSVSRPDRFNTYEYPWHTLNTRLDGPRRQSGCFGEERKSPVPVDIRISYRSALALGTILTTLPQLATYFHIHSNLSSYHTPFQQFAFKHKITEWPTAQRHLQHKAV